MSYSTFLKKHLDIFILRNIGHFQPSSTHSCLSSLPQTRHRLQVRGNKRAEGSLANVGVDTRRVRRSTTLTP
jgi:hypothetical protein